MLPSRTLSPTSRDKPPIIQDPLTEIRKIGSRPVIQHWRTLLCMSRHWLCRCHACRDIPVLIRIPSTRQALAR